MTLKSPLAIDIILKKIMAFEGIGTSIRGITAIIWAEFTIPHKYLRVLSETIATASPDRLPEFKESSMLSAMDSIILSSSKCFGFS